MKSQSRNLVMMVKETLRVSDALAALGVDLPGRGRRIPCPVHGGENPTSFSFSDRTWHCFACGAGGDVISLVMKIRRVDFNVALQWLAGIAGVSARRQSPRQKAQLQHNMKLRRRLESLRRWRNATLDETLCLLAALERSVDVTAASTRQAMERRDPTEEEKGWRQLETLYKRCDDAEWLAARLEMEDVFTWAAVWSCTHRSENGRGEGADEQRLGYPQR